MPAPPTSLFGMHSPVVAQRPMAQAGPPPRLAIPPLRRGGALGAVDLTRPQYRVGNNNTGTTVANVGHAGEFLQAVPMIKAEYAYAQTAQTPGTSSNTMQVVLSRAALNGTTVTGSVGRYDNLAANPVLSLSTVGQNTGTAMSGGVDQFPMARIGVRFPALRLDSDAGPRHTALNPQDSYLMTAIALALRNLDTSMGQGAGLSTAPQDMRGLTTFGNATNQSPAQPGYGRSTTVTTLQTQLLQAIMAITVTGSGAGAGCNCLIGGSYALRSLIATTAGTSSTSGWKLDERSGLVVYHWLGLPYYRVDCETASPSTGVMFAAHLGPCGLSLVHTAGTAETFGLQVDELPITESSGNRELTVHGAFALVAWEAECIWQLTGIP